MVQHVLDEMVDLESVEQHDDHENPIEILLVGDPSVGKTSLIYSLVNDEFEPNVPAKMADIDVPAEITPEKVPLHVVDYSERDEEYPNQLYDAIVRANVICIIYDASNEESLDRVATNWIPQIHKYQNEKALDTNTTFKPIILVANKIDLIEEDRDDNPLLDKITRIVQEYIDIEAHIETSALSQRNVVELFATAQKTVVYPLLPIFDPHLRALTKKCRNALVKIFKLCDLDGNGILTDYELNLFHENCFGVPLQTGALEDLKSVVKQSIMGGIIDNGITETGFLFIHTLSIDKGRHEFTWQVLKKFNYDYQLNRKQSKVMREDNELNVNFSQKDSFTHSSLMNSDIRRTYSNSSSEYEFLEDEDSDNIETDSLISNNLDQSWLSEHSNIIKAGLGLTLASLMTMLALKFLIQNNSKSFS